MWAVPATVLVFALVVAAVLAVKADRQYGRIDTGGLNGVASMASFSTVDDTSDVRVFRLTAASGQVVESMANLGSHSVKVTSLSSGGSVSGVQWAPLPGPDNPSTFADVRWQSFPALIPAYGTIQLLVTVHRAADCPVQDPQSYAGPIYDGDHRVHWDSLLGSHTTKTKGFSQRIELC